MPKPENITIPKADQILTSGTFSGGFGAIESAEASPVHLRLGHVPGGEPENRTTSGPGEDGGATALGEGGTGCWLKEGTEDSGIPSPKDELKKLVAQVEAAAAEAEVAKDEPDSTELKNEKASGVNEPTPLGFELNNAEQINPGMICLDDARSQILCPFICHDIGTQADTAVEGTAQTHEGEEGKQKIGTWTPQNSANDNHSSAGGQQNFETPGFRSKRSSPAVQPTSGNYTKVSSPFRLPHSRENSLPMSAHSRGRNR